ncbi:Rsm22-cox11 tandem protein [Phanerochaete sordida]|uniref:Rsm22-cox11 tandem protein n=1 Tax=Phanerochaete sordida TaxID=48140 RepID=A0A9P3G114_9APHY|nr:Rsm22-cox11 tandem protein [Phanerochaete sordida]
MLRSVSTRALATTLRREARLLSSTASTSAAQPNAPIELDSSMKALLRDVDMSLLRHKVGHPTELGKPPRELEVYPSDPDAVEDYMTSEELESQEPDYDGSSTRKSPAAIFGSHRIGAVILPYELQKTIAGLIQESDKSMLHVDAKRLFMDEDEDGEEWGTTYDVRYKTLGQRIRHGERDGTAFASVALPAHYSAISAVLHHTKQRLGSEWSVQHVIDWGAGTGSGLWASTHAFQKPPVEGAEVDEVQFVKSTLASYIGIEKRDGLVKIGKRLLKGTDVGGVSVSWQRTFHEENKLPRVDGGDVLALCAFALSAMPNAVARKKLVKEMWESGADIMVLIDHNTTAGFECIAEARDNLLRMGKREMEDPDTEDWAVRGSHVVAPCPHDGACPLFNVGPKSLVCGFSQRLQRPEFVRKTKHSKIGHEDVGYSYVVIRRGTRPERPQGKFGRIGDIGRRELDKIAAAQASMPELVIDGDDIVPDKPSRSLAKSLADPSLIVDPTEADMTPDQVEDSLRLEAYHWPRVVFPPLKRSGHIVIDSCAAEGNIIRMTVPKSQGKQPYYDARKSAWGDIFPHDPKNAPQVRFTPEMAGRKAAPGDQPKSTTPRTSKHSYSSLQDELKDKQNRIRRDRRRQVQAYTDIEASIAAESK